VLGHIQRSIHFSFVTSPREVAAAGALAAERGSNTWAIGPRRSSSGFAILLANPHLPWSDLYTWHEAQLATPDLDAYGAALVGTPFLGIAFNDHLGWSHTVNTHDGADLYELVLQGEGYRFDGEVHAFEVEEHSLEVREEGGRHRTVPLAVRRSVHGPVVAELNEGRALALRVVGLDSPHLLRQYLRMAAAEDRDQFEAALRELQMPMFTVMYADRDGHILHLFGGRTPVRSMGDWDFWSGVVPGDRSELLWTQVHPYGDLPRIADPPSQWLQNANDPPWTTTFPPPLDPDRFPPYMAPRFMHFRAQRSARMLAEDESLSFDEVVRYKHSTRMELADRILAELDAAVRAGSGELAKAANDVLQTWDRSADARSRGAVLFARFAERLLARGEGVFGVPWSEEEPRATPDGFADPLVALAALESAARQVVEEHGALDVAWGQVHRLRRGGWDLPASGGPGELGIFRVVGYRRDADGLHRAVGGDGFEAVVELSTPPRAMALLGYGNSSQPGSPHNGDQLELFARQELRPVWRERDEIEAHLEEREDLSRHSPAR
jgi:acyl-homoserine-lactone acylase